MLCSIVVKLLSNLLSRVLSYSHLFQVLVGEGQRGGVLSLLSECEILSFHILRSSPCPFQCFTCLKVTCCRFIQSLACGKQTLFSALVSPAKEMPEKMSAPHRLSSLVLLFQGHVACRNFYPNRVLIPTHSSLALQGQVRENTRKRLTISSFQQKNVLYLPTHTPWHLSHADSKCMIDAYTFLQNKNCHHTIFQFRCSKDHCVIPENIHTPPPRMVNGISKGWGGAKGQKFLRGMGGAHEKNFPQGYKRRERSYESYLSMCGLFLFVLQQKSAIDALSRKNLKM